MRVVHRPVPPAGAAWAMSVHAWTATRNARTRRTTPRRSSKTSAKCLNRQLSLVDLSVVGGTHVRGSENIRWSFQDTLAWWALGLIESTELPAGAARGLEDGLDSASLRSLAGLERSDSHGCAGLLERAAAELGLRVPDQREAARHLATQLSKRIIQGDLDAIAGARMVAEVSRAVESPGFHDLDVFVYADSEANDRPEDREFFIQRIFSEARRWTV